MSVQCDKGDLIYIFSDGYADQKGGEENRKFYSKRVQEMVLKNHKLPLQDQHVLLERTFQNWKGSNDQVDDVTILGFQI